MGWEDKRGYYRYCGLSTSLVWSLIDGPWWFHVSGPGMKWYIIVEELGGVKLFPSATRKQRAVSELNHDTNNKGPQRLTLNDLLPPARPHPLQFYRLPVIYSKSESIIGLNYWSYVISHDLVISGNSLRKTPIGTQCKLLWASESNQLDKINHYTTKHDSPSLSPPPLTITCLISISMILITLDPLYQWNHIVCVLLELACFT